VVQFSRFIKLTVKIKFGIIISVFLTIFMIRNMDFFSRGVQNYGGNDQSALYIQGQHE